MGVIEVSSAITGLKTALDIVKGLKDTKSDTEMQSKISELLGALIDVQESVLSSNAAQFEMQVRIDGLEAQLKNIDDWEQQRNRYTLVNPWRGPGQVFALKQSCAVEEESAHYLCPTCFLKAERVILTPIQKNKLTHMICPTCNTVIDTGYVAVGPPKFAEEHNTKD